jgi:biofilm PGA synthesis N-glycosyltransferase PgaC
VTWVFWAAFFFVFYSYIGYPVWLWARGHWRLLPVRKSEGTPSISIVIAAFNEAATLRRKLTNLSDLRYPRNLLEIIVVSDGSTDETDQVLKAAAGLLVRPVLLPTHEGKAFALNCGIAAARGEVVVFMDVRQEVEPDALNQLVRNFADPTVGCVSGELILRAPESASGQDGLGLYWRLEKAIRKMESETGSVVGATGALYAVRRELLVEIPPGTLLDDVYLPLCIAAKKKRVVFEPEARAWDNMPDSASKEFRRKVRTLTGNYQLLELAPWLFTRNNPLRFEFVSHKLSRLLVPFALVALFVSCIFLRGFPYRETLVAQICFYSSAALSAVRVRPEFISRLSRVALAFLLLNVAAAMALVNFISGKRAVWVRP